MNVSKQCWDNVLLAAVKQYVWFTLTNTLNLFKVEGIQCLIAMFAP